jgi:hypothetical protein
MKLGPVEMAIEHRLESLSYQLFAQAEACGYPTF